MSGGFWAGAVPPWAYAVGACLFILAVLLGMWAGYERGFRHAAEEQRWEREQAKARRTHPAYRQPPERTRVAIDYRPDPIPGLRTPIWSSPEVAHEAWLAHEDQALTIANEQIHDRDCIHRGLSHADGCFSQAITTGEIQAITDRVDEWMATWIGDGHALSDG